jgi:hypothetical protein
LVFCHVLACWEECWQSWLLPKIFCLLLLVLSWAALSVAVGCHVWNLWFERRISVIMQLWISCCTCCCWKC